MIKSKLIFVCVCHILDHFKAISSGCSWIHSLHVIHLHTDVCMFPPILSRPVLQCTWLGCLAGRVGCLPGPYNVTNMKAELRNEQKISTWCSSSELQSRKTTVTVNWLLVSLTWKCCPIVSLFRAKRTLCPTSAKHQEKGGVAELSVRYPGCFWNV